MQSTFKERVAWRLIRWLRLNLGVDPVEHDLVREQRDTLELDLMRMRRDYDRTFAALVRSRLDIVGLRARLDAREVRLRHYERQLAGKKQGRRGPVPTPKVPVT
jgi:hypothetical protein